MTENHPPHDPNQPPQQQPASSYPGGQPSPPPYPGDQYSAGYGGPGGPPAAPPERPSAVRNAVWLMIVGAALSAISIVVGLATIGDVRQQIRDELQRQGTTDVTSDMVNAGVAFAVAVAVVIGVGGVLLWLWMAWKNGQGRAWARIVATVLAGLNLLFTLIGFAGAAGQAQAASASPIGTGINVLQLLVAIVVIVLLWSRPARAYYDEVGARRAAERYAPGR